MMNNQLRQLYNDRHHADNYAQWHEISMELDRLTGLDEWKSEPASNLYNYSLLSERLNQFKQWRLSNDDTKVIRGLREGLHHDLGNMSNPLLYGRSHVGTKALIEQFVDEICTCIDYLSHRKMSNIKNQEKIALFSDVLKSFGEPALQLSGGATLGMFHIGVCKALEEQGILPYVISGSSAGSLVASIIGSHTPEELKEFYDGDRLFKTAWRWNKLRDGFSGKGFANQQQLEIFLRENIGDLTFEEAFAKSGKHINVSISAVGANQKSRLMNELTSPYLLVWSAVLASCAVPLLFPPVTLTSKTADGSSRPYMHLERWVDGSMRNDMPKKRLMRLYNVNYFIASQVNPHIVPLLESERRRIARTRLTSLPRRFIKTQAKLLTMGTLQVIHDASRNEALRQSLNHAYSMISQNYYGDVTIAPERYTLRHYANMLQNPTKESIIWFRQQGERATWPKVDQIRIQAKISRKLRDTIDKLEKSSLTLQDTHQQEVVVG